MPQTRAVMARQLVCIIGWPVTTSLSPAIHAAAFAATGLDWTYVPLPVRPGAAAEGVGLLRTLAAVGANVTVPHKEAVIATLDGIDDESRSIGAVNTIVRNGDALLGENTDARGCVAALREDGFDATGKSALILGAGGAARAVAMGLAMAGAHVSVAARRDDAAAAVARIHEDISVASWDALPAADLVVQATSVMDGLPLQDISFGEIALDIIYGRGETPFLAAARSAGAQGLDGLGMLIHQAALSFTRWTGKEAPIDAMRAAALAG